PTTARRLACDAKVQLLLDDRAGNRGYLGRSRRFAPDAQVRALTARDGEQRRFPGRSHTPYRNPHHIIPWELGGTTDVDNLITATKSTAGSGCSGAPTEHPFPAPSRSPGRRRAWWRCTRRRPAHQPQTISSTRQGDSLDVEHVLGLLLLSTRIPAAAWKAGFQPERAGSRCAKRCAAAHRPNARHTTPPMAAATASTTTATAENAMTASARTSPTTAAPTPFIGPHPRRRRARSRPGSARGTARRGSPSRAPGRRRRRGRASRPRRAGRGGTAPPAPGRGVAG